MQNTFSQSGNDSKWFLKKSFFKIAGKRDPLETPPSFMANAILNFHFDYLTPSLSRTIRQNLGTFEDKINVLIYQLLEHHFT